MNSSCPIWGGDVYDVPKRNILLLALDNSRSGLKAQSDATAARLESKYTFVVLGRRKNFMILGTYFSTP